MSDMAAWALAVPAGRRGEEDGRADSECFVLRLMHENLFWVGVG